MERSLGLLKDNFENFLNYKLLTCWEFFWCDCALVFVFFKTFNDETGFGPYDKLYREYTLPLNLDLLHYLLHIDCWS